MLSNKNGRKMRHPYVKLTILGLAATGVASIVMKGKKFIKEKKDCITGMVKNMRYE